MSDPYNQEIQKLLEEFANRVREEAQKQIIAELLRTYGQTLVAGGNAAPEGVQPGQPSSSAQDALGSITKALRSSSPPPPAGAPTTPPEPNRAAVQSLSDLPPGVRRTREQLEELAKAVTDTVRKARGGLRVEEIQREMGVASADLSIPIRMALEWGWLKKRGQRRGTTYFVR